MYTIYRYIEHHFLKYYLSNINYALKTLFASYYQYLVNGYQKMLIDYFSYSLQCKRFIYTIHLQESRKKYCEFNLKF